MVAHICNPSTGAAETEQPQSWLASLHNQHIKGLQAKENFHLRKQSEHHPRYFMASTWTLTHVHMYLYTYNTLYT